MANHHAAVLPLALDFGPDLQVQCTRSSSCLRSPRARADTQPQRQPQPLNLDWYRGSCLLPGSRRF